MRWQIKQAQQRFSAVLRAASTDGPQTIARHGKDAYVVVDIGEYRRLTSPRPPDLTSVLAGRPLFCDATVSITAEIATGRRADRPSELPLSLGREHEDSRPGRGGAGQASGAA
jgi:prevent-host-death family protein